MTAVDQLPAITERIVKRFKPLQIILFGSQARGDTHQWSDIDLLVVLPDVASKWKSKQEIELALREFLPAPDVTVSTPDEIRQRGNMVGTVLRPALREGRVLYERVENGNVPDAEPVSEEDAATEAAAWLAFAEDDLVAANRLIDMADLVPRVAGFQAQRASELALKAIYVFLQTQYSLTHDLNALRAGLPADWTMKRDIPDLNQLSMWAVAQQYPGVQQELTHEDVRRHVQQARALIDAVRRDLRAHGFTEDH